MHPQRCCGEGRRRLRVQVRLQRREQLAVAIVFGDWREQRGSEGCEGLRRVPAEQDPSDTEGVDVLDPRSSAGGLRDDRRLLRLAQAGLQPVEALIRPSEPAMQVQPGRTIGDEFDGAPEALGQRDHLFR